MYNGRKAIAIGLVTCLLALPFSNWGASAQAKGRANPTLVKQQVDEAGVGSYVALKLTDGKKLKGRLEAIDKDGLTVNLLNGQDRQAQVSYERLAKLKVVKRRSYRARGQPKPALARQAVEGLGVGTHVMVKILGRMLFRGNIQAVEEKSFTLQLDISGQLIPISYDQVVQVRENNNIQNFTVKKLLAVIAFIAGFIALQWLIRKEIKNAKGSPKPKAAPSIAATPSISSLSPNSVESLGDNFILTVKGSNFNPRAEVRWNGATMATIFISRTELRAGIPAANIRIAGTVLISVSNRGRDSNSIPFTTPIVSRGSPKPKAAPSIAAPSISFFTPNSVEAGGNGFSLTVNGRGFNRRSEVRWNGIKMATRYVSKTELRVRISAEDIVRAGTAQITVFNPSGVRGLSNSLTYQVTPRPSIDTPPVESGPKKKSAPARFLTLPNR